MNLLRKIIKERDGQATLEFAIIVPILLLIIMIIIYIGLFLFSKIVVLMSAHEGGREGMLIWNIGTYTQEQKIQTVKDSVQSAVESLPNGEDAEIIVEDNNDGILEVTVSYPYELKLPLISDIIGSDDPMLSSTVTYRYAQAPDGESGG